MTQFHFQVDFDDKRWSSLRRDKYESIYADLKIAHVPVTRRGQAQVEAEIVRYDNGISIHDYLSECERLGFPRPDRAIGITFLESYPNVPRESYVVIPCGPTGNLFHIPAVPCIIANRNGRVLRPQRLYSPWHPNYRFLRVCGIQPLSR